MIETRLNVKGMSCRSCVNHIGRALTELGGVDAVEVRLDQGTVTVRHADGVEPARLRGAVIDAGYEAELAA